MSTWEALPPSSLVRKAPDTSDPASLLFQLCLSWADGFSLFPPVLLSHFHCSHTSSPVLYLFLSSVLFIYFLLLLCSKLCTPPDFSASPKSTFILHCGSKPQPSLRPSSRSPEPALNQRQVLGLIPQCLYHPFVVISTAPGFVPELLVSPIGDFMNH